jgi:hypothetical protein
MARTLRLLFFLTLASTACSDAESPEALPPDGEIEQAFLFDVYYVNGAWGYVLKGTYVDNQGNVVSYDHSFERWAPEDYRRMSFTLGELKEKYIAASDTIAHVDKKTLLDMYSLIGGAARGEISKGERTGFDIGTFAHVCYVYNQDTGRYGEVLLSQTGDYTRRNVSDEAIELVSWLNSLMFDAYDEGNAFTNSNLTTE